MYKQVIVVNKELNMSSGKMAAQVSHASMAFLTTMVKEAANMVLREPIKRYPCYEDINKTRVQLYKRLDLNNWAELARLDGHDCFYARPVDKNNPNGELMLCEPKYEYKSTITVEREMFDEWISGIFTKVILEAKNESRMRNIVELAKDAGMIEGKDFFCIRDACLTELTPDETGTRWTCIGFAPMDNLKIDVITKRLQLYKG